MDSTPEPSDVFWNERKEMALTCDGSGRIVWADPVAQERLGLSRGKDLLALVPAGAEDKARSILERARGARLRDAELPLLSRGSIATFSVCACPRADGDLDLLLSHLPERFTLALSQVQESMAEIVSLNREVSRQKADIQQQKQELESTYRNLAESNRGVVTLHAELEDKAASLRRASDVKSRVVANVSHEFRTPLHTILGLSKLLLDAADGPLTSEQEKQVRYIRSSAEELQHLVNDLLDLSRAESGKAQLRPEKFTVEQLFQALRGQMRPLLDPGAAVQLVFDAPPAVELETDHGKIAQILRNLISNAIKFTEDGEVRVSAHARDGRIAFEVTDTGIGIAEEHLDLIFEEFGQVDSPLQKKVRGTGLGLPLSRRLAELLEGTLEAKSSPGQGSTFTLDVPQVHSEVRELATLASRPLDTSKAPVLVVEDDRKTIFIYEKYLAMTGFQVMPARTIEEARRLITLHRPAAVVLDVMLEGETSWDFLAELKRNPETSDIPVLVVTVTSRAQKARALGADEFWLKPVDQDRLIKKLKSLTRPGVPTNVLVIDDDEKARYLIRKLLTGTPYRLTEAENGHDGVRLAQESRPHVILLDFLLEEMTAFDVLDELKADPRTRQIPVIVVTSHVLDPRDRSRLLAETEAILSKDNLSRELAINRIRDALRKAGVATNHGQ
jgi:signal transduction histidine kinase/response regulator RpfG family c-di-GMP phosphodiesterase